MASTFQPHQPVDGIRMGHTIVALPTVQDRWAPDFEARRLAILAVGAASLAGWVAIGMLLLR